jgi:hypothetical protein
MRRTLIALLIALLLVPDLPARGNHDWDNVKKIKPGTTLEIQLKSGDQFYGELDQVSDSGLRIYAADNNSAQTNWQHDLDRKQIRRIVRFRRSSHLPNPTRWMAIGAVAGGAIGVGAGAIGDAKHGNNGRWLVDGFAGALLGFFASCAVLAGVAVVHAAQLPRHTRVIYEDNSLPPAKDARGQSSPSSPLFEILDFKFDISAAVPSSTSAETL